MHNFNCGVEKLFKNLYQFLLLKRRWGGNYEGGGWATATIIWKHAEGREPYFKADAYSRKCGVLKHDWHRKQFGLIKREKLSLKNLCVWLRSILKLPLQWIDCKI